MELTLAGCVILDEEGRVLLMHRNTPKRTQWETPGGKVESGEKPGEAAKREVAEELGIIVDIIKKLGENSFEEDGYKMTYHWFLSEITSGKPTIREQEFDDLRYFSWDELNQMSDLSSNTQNLVRAYTANKLLLLNKQ